ncbi:MAG TPA: hypothetical protein VLK85_10710 [Ramlibacter sp.]|nr:hypothetical protein [Ramlibacter sp.]
MNQRFFVAAFIIGLAALAWVGLGFVGSNWLALAMTVVIGGVYLLGAGELRQFRAGTAGLASALADTGEPSSLGGWLERVPPSLRPAVRLRIEGERAALPGPALTPYLVGLLVMLGMLGTFLGMVVTFKGAVFALEGSTDLQAIRSALAEPIKGLGLSFGTSVAGVAASAMLGLMSTVSRRERLDVARWLDTRVATVLRPFSLVHQRQETYRALQLQAGALPEVVDKLEALMARIEQRGQQLDERLQQRQQQFHDEARLAYAGLAREVGAALQDSLVASSRAAGDSIRPLVDATMTRIVEDTRRLHEGLDAVATRQVEALSQQFSATARGVAEQWTAALAEQERTLARTQSEQARGEQQRLQAWTEALQAAAAELQAQWRRVAEQAGTQQQAAAAQLQRAGSEITVQLQQAASDIAMQLQQAAGEIAGQASAQALRTLADADRLLAQSQELVRSRSETEARWLEQHAQRMDQLAGLWRTELAALRAQEDQRGQAAVDRLGGLQAAVAQHLASLGAALEAPLTRLLQTAAEVPQAAAGVIAQLRQEMSRVSERDNLALQERTVLLERLGSLLQAVQQTTGEQRAATEAMVASASSVLERAGLQFADAVATHAGQAGDMAAQVGGSALELSSLAEAFGQAVQLFQASNDKLTEGLQRIEASLLRSTARSDEQLAYYVAQAREVIDLSIASQQGLVENLRQLQPRPGKAMALADAGAA